MRGEKDFSVRTISRIGNGLGVFLTKEVKKLGWSKGAYVVVRIQDDGISIKKMDVPKK